MTSQPPKDGHGRHSVLIVLAVLAAVLNPFEGTTTYYRRPGAL